MMTEGLTTVLVHESPRAGFGDAQITLVGRHGRMVLGQRNLTLSDVSGVRDVTLRPSPDPVTFAVAALRDELAATPHGAAGLGDALAAARALEVAADSYERGTWVEST
jgi:hypothetical protein